MSLDFQLRLVDGITPGARSAGRSLDALNRQLRVVDRDLDQSARRRARTAAAQLQSDRQTTAQARRGAAERTATARREASELEALARRVTQTQEREARQREAIARRELRARIAANSEAARATASRVRESQARGDRTQRGVGQGLMALGGGAVALLAMAGQYGDEQRERNRVQQQLDLRVQQLASSGIGNGSAAGGISAAIERTAMGTGANVDELLAGLTMAQGRFGALNTDAGRSQWLAQGGMLEQLTRTALGAGSSLEDVVATAGELQRQLNVAPTALPDTLAQMIVMGRQGSIEFRDFAQHFGQLAGLSRRFMRAGTAQESAAANALTGTLYQFAGRAGLDGAEGATSTRALLSEITSSRGQRRLTAALGVNAFDASGQLIAGRGQGQDEAFMGMVETLYRRTRGNSTRFAEALGGHSQEAAALTSQLYLDLQQHGGRLADFRGLDLGARGATAANTQERAYRDLQGTEAFQRARAESALLYRQNHSAFARGTNATETQLRDLQADSPALHTAITNTPIVNAVSRGLMDRINTGFEATRMGLPTADAMMGARTPSELFRMQARNNASAQIQEHLGPLTMFLGENNIRERVNARAEELYQESVAHYERTTGRRASEPIALDGGTMQGMRAAVRDGMTEAMQNAPGAVPGGGGAPASGFARGGE